jgi:hypothetical protein
MTAGRMASLSYLIPVVAIVLGWASLGDAASALGRRRRPLRGRRLPRAAPLNNEGRRMSFDFVAADPLGWEERGGNAVRRRA